MKTHKLLIFILCLSVMMSGNGIYAQDYVPTPVTISKEKVRVDGKLYYSHIVLERQTLYSICKAYGVNVEDIYSANPSLIDTGLKKNAIILIPVVEKAKVEKAQKKQQKKTEESGNFIIHTVRWFEDLDVIAEKYGVSVESIMQANGLKGRKLSSRQKLRIPIDGSAPSGPETPGQKPDSTMTGTPVSEERHESVLFPGFSKKQKVNAVLMLPFNVSGENSRPSTGNIDYYCGTLMAVKKLGENGTDISLSVYDIADGNLHITLDRLQSSDIVLGPVSSGDIGRLLNVAPANTVVVSPLDHRSEQLTLTYPNLIQAPSSPAAQIRDLVNWINEDRTPADQVIVIHEKGYEMSEENVIASQMLENTGIPYKSFSYSILEGREITTSLEGLMNPETGNKVLVLSESEAFVNDVIRNLNLMIYNGYDIVLYGPSRIRSFETIETDNLHNVNLHTSVSYFIDYDSEDVRKFLMEYRALFNTEPTPYAFQGYDTACFLLDCCSKYGDRLTDRLGETEASMLQTNFRFERKAPGKGYVNNAVRRVVYGPDYSITLIK